MMVADGTAASTAFSPAALARAYCEVRALIGADRRDMHHARAGGGCRLRHRVGAPGLHGVKGLAAALGQECRPD